MQKRISTAKWIEKYRRWQINVQKDGVRRSFYSSKPGRAGQRECNAKADAWLDDNIESPNIKTAVLYEKWMDELKITTSKSHWMQYEGYGKNYIIPAIGKIKISTLNEQHLQNIVNLMYKKGLSKKTLLNAKACLVAFLKFCRKLRTTNLIPENLKIPNGAKESEKSILQPDDLKILFTDQEYNEHFINAFRFQVLTGLRPGELIGLKFTDIDGNTVHLQRSINVYQEETAGKNKNSRRNFVLTDKAQQVLENQREYLQSKDIPDDEYIFPDKFGLCAKEKTYYDHWVKFRDRYGLSKVTPYELRHTFVSIVKSLPTGFLKQLVGHSKDMDTYGVYSHMVDGESERTAQMISDIFNNVL